MKFNKDNKNKAEKVENYLSYLYLKALEKKISEQNKDLKKKCDEIEVF